MRNQAIHPRTEIINKKQKNQAKLARQEALVWLAKMFPHAFDTTLKIQPLKQGIMEEILTHNEAAKAAGISKSKLREAVVVFTRRIDYLACLKAREMRVDLSGCLITPVTPAEAEQAALKIKKRIEKSAKNARNKIGTKLKSARGAKPIEHFSSWEEQSFSDRPDDVLGELSMGALGSKTPIMVKHKTSRTFDPEAVLRLKEKLGLSRKSLSFEETPESS